MPRMKTLTYEQRTDLEHQAILLRARERGLRGLVQSPRCNRRSEAEVELDKVHAELELTYDQLRHDHPHGAAGPRYPRG